MLGARRDDLHYHLYLTINMLLRALISAALATAAAAGECNKSSIVEQLPGNEISGSVITGNYR